MKDHAQYGPRKDPADETGTGQPVSFSDRTRWGAFEEGHSGR
jgi:hypothetical protein